MAEPKKKKTAKTEDATVRVVGDKVVIESFKVKNPSLAEILRKEKNKNKQLDLFEEIIDLGTNLYNTLKGRAETDFAKDAFETIKGQLDEKLDSTLKNIQKEYESYFDSKKGALPKALEESSKDIEDNSNALVESFSEKTEGLIGDLEETFDEFLDENSKKSALGKISELLKDFDSKIEDMLEESKKNQISAFEKALDPEETKSKINILRDQIIKSTSSEVETLTKKLDEIIKKLNIQTTEDELKEKSTGKGTDFEDIVQSSLAKIATPIGDLAEPTGKQKGKTGDKGDHTVGLDKNSTGLKAVTIVFESKARTLTVKNIKEELDACMDNRSAEIGVMVFDSQKRIEKITELPFMTIDVDKAIVVLNQEEGGSLPLQVAYMWARAAAINLSTDTVDEAKLDIAELHNKITNSIGALGDIKTIKKNHTNAKNAIEDASKWLSSLEGNLKENLNSIQEMFEDLKDE